MIYLGKTRESLFKSSIRIQNPNIDPKEEMEKMKDVCENLSFGILKTVDFTNKVL